MMSYTLPCCGSFSDSLSRLAKVNSTIIAVLMGLGLIIPTLAAQTIYTPVPTTINVPTPTVGSNEPVQLSTHEVVRLTNNSVDFFLPVVSLPQRGGDALTIGFRLSGNHYSLKEPYNQFSASSSFKDDLYPTQTTIEQIQDVAPPWYSILHPNYPTLTADLTYAGMDVHDALALTDPPIWINNPEYCMQNWTFTDWDGSVHLFNGTRDCSMGHGSYYSFAENITLSTQTSTSVDDAFYVLDATVASDIKIIRRNGTVYHFSGYKATYPENLCNSCASTTDWTRLYYYNATPSSIVDVNGNTITFNGATLTDPSNKVVSLTGGATNTVASITYQAMSGTTVKSVTASVTSRTVGMSSWPIYYPASGSSGFNGPCQVLYVDPNRESIQAPQMIYQGPGTSTSTGYPTNTIYTISLPQTSQGTIPEYVLTFDIVGNLIEVQYPSGGYTKYDYLYNRYQNSQTFGDVKCFIPSNELLAKHECSLVSGNCTPATTVTSITSCTAGHPAGGETTTCYRSSAKGIVDSEGNMIVLDPAELGYVAATSTSGASSPTNYYPGFTTYGGEDDYQGTSTLLKSVRASFASSPGCTNALSYVNQKPCSLTTTYYTGNGTPLASTKQYQYDSVAPYNITQIQEQDYSGAILTSDVAQWNHDGIYAAPIAGQNTPGNLLDKISSRQTTDPMTGKTRKTLLSYDGHGNLTQSAVSGSDVATLTTLYTPLDAYGRPTQMQDPVGNITKYSYADTWNESSCAPSTNSSSYLTSVTNPLNQMINYTYDSCTGALGSATDPNGNQTSYTYDVLGRVESVTFPTGGGSEQVLYTDTAPNAIQETRTENSTTNLVKTSVFDGFSRTDHVQVTGDPRGAIYTYTTYDSLGRTTSVSNPYFTFGDVTYGLTTFTYDALGQKTSQTAPDQKTQQWCYDGLATNEQTNCFSNASSMSSATWIDEADEAGSDWQRSSDALGRQTSVMEPPANSGGASVETDYTYNGFSDLMRVKQTGLGADIPRIRSFSYDSLSRPVTSTNPETGTICYGTLSGTTCTESYDGDGNLRAKTDARGVTTDYSYDALNRLVSKTYSGASSWAVAIAAATLPATYVYDGSTVTNGIGRLASEYTGPASNPVSRTSIQVYDPMGRVKQETTVAPNVSSTVLASFDLAGHRIALTYPDGRTVQDGFDSAGRLNSSATTSFGGNPVTQTYVNPQQIAYDAAGHVIGADYGNGTQYFAAYDNRERVTTMTYGPPGPLWSKQYAWTANSNLQSQTDLVTGVQRQYNYDNLNRLTAAQDIYSSLAVSSTANGDTTSTSTSGSGAEETPGGTGALPEWTDPYDSNLLEEIGETDWVAPSSVTITTNAAAAPDGTSTAAQVMASSSASGASSIYIQGSIATPSAYSLETMAGSVWLKSADSTSPTINLYLMANGAAAASKQIQLSQSWQQVGLSASMPDNLTSLYFEIGGGGTISAGHGVQIWNAMLEDHGTAGSSITNYLPYSQLPTASTWSAYGSGIAVNSASAPDGSQTASTVSQPRAATGFYLQDSVTNPAPANQQQITGSIFLQAVSGSISLTVSIQETSGGTATQCGATPVTLTTAWQRIRVNCTAQNALSVLTLLINGAPVDRSFSFNLWGAQLELASTAGPYVATDSIPATSETTLTNLLPYSEQLNYTGWQNAQNTISATKVAAPDGSLTASQISQAAGGTQMTDLTPTPEIADGLTVTGSVYLKWVSGPTTVTLDLYAASSAGTQALGAQTVTLTSTWQRFQTTVTLPSGLTSLGIQFGGTPNQTYQAWGAQLEIASHAGPYVETSALPIITGSEPTNILPNSQSLSGPNWVPFSSATTVTPNYAAAPDGTTTAALLQASSSSTDSGIKVGVPNPSLYDGETVTASVYLRSLSATQHVNLYLQNIGATGSTAAAFAGVNATTTWQRFDLTATLENGNTSISLQIGGGGSISLGQSIEIWGAQFVIGSAPAPYTPTPSTTTVWATGTPGTLVQTGLNQAYSYDSFGNITQNGSFSTSYTANNQMVGYAYDAAGNLLSDGINIMTWDAENRMATAAGATYIYDAEGNRVEKQGSAVMDTIYFGGQPIARYSGGQWTDLIYGPNGLLAEVPGTQNGVPLYRATDYEGTIVGSLLANGTFVDPIDHTPFGQVFTGNTSDPYLFTGKERDAESGLDYFGARYYASNTGRWMSPDWADKPEAVPYSSLDNPQSLNLYSYVGNNPLSKADPDGHCWPFCLAPAGGGVVGSLTTAAEAFGAGVSATFASGVAAVGVGLAALSSSADQAYFANGGAFNTAGAPTIILQQSGANQPAAPATPAAPEAGEKEAQPLVGNNPKEAGSRTNTDLPGGHAAAEKTFGEQTAGQQTRTDPKTGHQVAEDGSRLRKNPDGTARVDLPNRGAKPNGETIHFNQPDPKPQP